MKRASTILILKWIIVLLHTDVCKIITNFIYVQLLNTTVEHSKMGNSDEQEIRNCTFKSQSVSQE